MRTIPSVIVLLFASTAGWSQIKIRTVTDETTPSSKSVMTALRSKLSTHPKEFTLVSNKEANEGLLVLGDCLPQKEKTEPFVCFYTAHFVGASSKTFMGGGIYSGVTPDEVADNFLASIAQDVAERWNEMIRDNAIESLESCLFLTQSTCKVPKILAAELKADVINLSQYLQKGGLKK